MVTYDTNQVGLKLVTEQIAKPLTYETMLRLGKHLIFLMYTMRSLQLRHALSSYIIQSSIWPLLVNHVLSVHRYAADAINTLMLNNSSNKRKRKLLSRPPKERAPKPPSFQLEKHYKYFLGIWERRRLYKM
jgi:hypothetical protein